MTFGLFNVTKDGEIKQGTISIRDGKLFVTGNQLSMGRMMSRDHFVNGERLTSKTNPQEWFDSLPLTYYNSTYFIVRQVPDAVKTDFASILSS